MRGPPLRDHQFVGTATIKARRLDNYDIVVHGGVTMSEEDVWRVLLVDVEAELSAGVEITELKIKIEDRSNV